jgi:hypothetical protein
VDDQDRSRIIFIGKNGHPVIVTMGDISDKEISNHRGDSGVLTVTVVVGKMDLKVTFLIQGLLKLLD